MKDYPFKELRTTGTVGIGSSRRVRNRVRGPRRVRNRGSGRVRY